MIFFMGMFLSRSAHANPSRAAPVHYTPLSPREVGEWSQITRNTCEYAGMMHKCRGDMWLLPGFGRPGVDARRQMASGGCPAAALPYLRLFSVGCPTAAFLYPRYSAARAAKAGAEFTMVS